MGRLDLADPLRDEDGTGYRYRALRLRIAALWPLRHQGRASEIRTLVGALRRLQQEG